MSKEKVVHREKKGIAELKVTKVQDEKGVIVDAGDIVVKDATPIPEKEKKPQPKKDDAPAPFIDDDSVPFTIGEEDGELQELDCSLWWVCPICTKKNDNITSLITHIKTEHEVDPSVVLLARVSTTFFRWKGK